MRQARLPQPASSGRERVPDRLTVTPAAWWPTARRCTAPAETAHSREGRAYDKTVQRILAREAWGIASTQRFIRGPEVHHRGIAMSAYEALPVPDDVPDDEWDQQAEAMYFARLS